MAEAVYGPAQYKFSAPFGIWDLLLLRAIRLWPEDQCKQVDFIRHAYRMAEAGLERDCPEILELPEMMQYLKTVRLSIGGRETLCALNSEKAIDEEINKITSQGQLCGIIVTIAYWLVEVANRADLASWNRIVYWMEKDSKNWEQSFTKTEIVESWKKYETVAHFWAAHMYLGGFWHSKATFPVVTENEEMGQNLAYSKTFQDFGLCYKAKGSRKTLLNPDILHKFDVPYRGECSFGPFPDEWIKTLEGYSAPKDWSN